MAPIIAVLPGFVAASRSTAGDRAAESLTAAAQQIGTRLATGIAEQWLELQAVAQWATSDGIGGSFPLRLDTAKALNDRLAWMGVASPDGRVLASTGRVLEGQDVSARPWFRAGLQGPFAGDVHEAVLLQRTLSRPPGAEPLRLIDFATPLRRSDGSLIGVLGSHVDWVWMRDRVRNTPLPAGVEAMLVSREGLVMIGPSALEGQRLTSRTALAGAQGLTLVAQETWSDGQSYLVAVVPAGTAPGLPGFGWSVIVRQPPEAAFGMARMLATAIGAPLVAAGIFVLALGVFLGRGIGRPLAALAAAATALAEGRHDRPVPDARSTREAALLAAALARLDRPASDAGQFRGVAP